MRQKGEPFLHMILKSKASTTSSIMVRRLRSLILVFKIINEVGYSGMLISYHARLASLKRILNSKLESISKLI